MHDSSAVLEHPARYQPVFTCDPHTPAQAAWLDETCTLVEAFTARTDLDFEARSVAGLAVHLAGDFLFFHFEHTATWGRLEPGALAARLAQEVGSSLVEILRTLSAFFRFLAATGHVPHPRAQYIACYFESLATINTASSLRRPSKDPRQRR